MKVLLSTVGQRGYIARYFRAELPAGSSVIGSGNSVHTAGFSSCDQVVVVPDIAAPDYLDRFLAVVDEHRVDVVLSLSDADVGVIANVRGELTDRGVSAFIPDPRRARLTLDKVATAEFVASLGLAAPATTTDLDQALAWGPPLFVKPRCGSASVDAFAAHTAEELRFFMSRRSDMIAQQLVEGIETNVEICCDLDGRPIRACVWRKHESRRGETLCAETVDDDVALTAGLRLAAALGVPGPMDIDMIVVDGRPVVIEINARFGGGYPMSHLAGADFVHAIVDTASGRQVDPDFGYRVGVVMMKDLQPFAYPAHEPSALPGSVAPVP